MHKRGGYEAGRVRVTRRRAEQSWHAAAHEKMRTSIISRAAGLASRVHQALEGDTWLKAMGKARKALPRGTLRFMATAKSAIALLLALLLALPLAWPFKRS